MDKYEKWLLSNGCANKVIASKEKTGHYYVSDAMRDYELNKKGEIIMDKRITIEMHCFPDGTSHPTPGMYLRDYFAAKAMQGIISNQDILEKYFGKNCITTREKLTESVSEIAFDYTDAMIKERGAE